MRLLRRFLGPVIATISALLWLANRAFDFRDMSQMNVPPWFWSIVFGAIFFISIIGTVVVQGRELEHLKRELGRPAPEGRTDKQSIKSVLLVDRLESFMRQGGDIVEGLQRIQGLQASYVHWSTVIDWGREVYFVIKSKYPGYAAFFLSDQPPQNDLRKDLLLGYMNRRLGDIRALIEREHH